MATSVYEMDGVGLNNDLTSTYAMMRNLADYNSAQSAAQAEIQRDWQEKQNAKAMEFNASEAAKNRNWQQMMSNTAHQREIADLKAAGLNPVLSAMNGNGASVGSGATASGVTSSGAKGDVDMSMNNALVNILGTMLDNQTKIQQTAMSAVNNLAVADKYTETSKIVQAMINENQVLLARDYPQTLFGTLNSWSNEVVDLLNDSDLAKKANDGITTAVDVAAGALTKAVKDAVSRPGKSGIDHIKENYSSSKLKKYIDSVKRSFKNASGTRGYSYK